MDIKKISFKDINILFIFSFMSLPMKPAKVFTEQINARISPDLKEKLWYLKGQGVDVQTLFRQTLEDIVDEAISEMAEGKAPSKVHP